MYQLVSAIAKPMNSDGKWVALEIGGVALKTLYTAYSRVIATLTNPFLPDLVSLDLNNIAGQAAGQGVTFDQFLTNLGSTALPTSTTLQELAPKYAKYADAFHAGYKIAPAHPSAGVGSEYPPADMTWLLLTRPGTDYELFIRSCLVSVNGFYHLLDGAGAGVYVKDGNCSALLSRQNQIGLTSFRELGAITYVPITEQMIYKQDPAQLYRNRCYVDIGQDVSDKSVMLVLGGYLHVLDQQSFHRVSASAFAIDMGNISLLERFYESAPYLDLSSLQLDRTTRNPSQISAAQFLSDERLVKYLTLSQSFFVVLDNSDIFVERQAVRSSVLPDTFISYVRPEWPLIVGCGKVGNYWYTQEAGQYALNCHDAMRQNRLFTTANKALLDNVSAARDPRWPIAPPHTHFLKVGTQLSATAMTRQAWLDAQALLY